MTVVVVGDSNVDLEIRLPDGEGPIDHANPAPRLFGGGSAANTAAALARLGIGCRFVGAVGDDSFGRFAVSSLHDAGVDTSLVVRVSDVPTVVVIPVVIATGHRLIYVWPPIGGAHGSLDPRRAAAAVDGASWLHVSGICLRLSPAREATLAAMERAKRAGVPVSFDLNLRLENWGWDSEFRTIVETAVGWADIITGSAGDEISPLMRIDDPTAAARSLAAGGRVVVARVGRAGAIVCTGDAVETVPGFSVRVVDTVGAGDAFNAGFIAARTRGTDLVDAARWGNAVAALTIGRPGARSTPSPAEVSALLANEPTGRD